MDRDTLDKRIDPDGIIPRVAGPLVDRTDMPAGLTTIEKLRWLNEHSTHEQRVEILRRIADFCGEE